MFGIGETELVIIVVFAFMLFGPDKLPGMGRTLGRVLRQFREASDGFTEVVQTNIMDPASEELEKSPKQRRREVEASHAEDADAPEKSAEEAAPKRETFAERKARLQAERKAAEEAAAAREESEAEAEPGAKDSANAGTKEPAGTEDARSAAGQADSSTDAKKPNAPASAADLYALTAQRSSRSRAKEPTSREEDGSADA